MPEPSDKWAAGATYEEFMGRWSRLLAPRFVSWLSVRPSANWLDVGCGTGALAGAICSGADPASVVACDPSEPFIEYARRRHMDPRVSFVVGGVGQLPTRPGSQHREALATQLEHSLPREPDGVISLVARAWVVRGVAR